MNFEQLIQQIENIHYETQKFAVQQVNTSLTVRNILIDFYIVEFEQNGLDRSDLWSKYHQINSKKSKPYQRRFSTTTLPL